MLRKILVLLLLTSPVFGQGFSSSIARRVQSGSSTPSSCNAGPPTDIFYSTAAGLVLVCSNGVYVTLQTDATNLSGIVPVANGGTGTSTGALSAALGTITANSPARQSTVIWNNAAITFINDDDNVTDTASAAGSLLLRRQTSGVAKFTVDKAGNVVAAGTITAGTTAISCTGGTAGALCLPEGTVNTGVSAVDIIQGGTAGSHRPTMNNNAGTASQIALAADPLSFFASTTSAQLAGVLSDETGTGVAVFSGGPTLTGTTTVADLTVSGTCTGCGAGSAITVFDKYAAYGAGSSAAVANTMRCAGVTIDGQSRTFSKIGVRVVTGDNTNHIDWALYDSGGTRKAHVGATVPGTGTAWQTYTFAEGSQTIATGKYYLCDTSDAAVYAPGTIGGTSFASFFAIGTVTGATSGGATLTSITPPADNWSYTSGGVFTFVLY